MDTGYAVKYDTSQINAPDLTEKELCPDALLKEQQAAFAEDIERLKKRRSEFVSVPCPACGVTESKKVFDKFTFCYQKCHHCQTIYMNPRPTEGIMAAYYSDSANYRFWADQIFPASEEARREKIHRPRLERVIHYCQRYQIPSGTLLEVGPGFGTFSALANESGYFNRIVAVEPTPELATHCRNRGIDVIQKRVEDIGHEIEAVDVAVAFEVIEHLFSPHAFLEGLARGLVPGGLLVLTCPNGLGFDIATLGADSLAVDPEHVNLFNPESLSQLVSRCGFELLEVTTPGRLDAEFVREAVLDKRFDVSGNALLQRILIEEWDRLGMTFQNFLAENGLSSHMWLVARAVEE